MVSIMKIEFVIRFDVFFPNHVFESVGLHCGDVYLLHSEPSPTSCFATHCSCWLAFFNLIPEVHLVWWI